MIEKSFSYTLNSKLFLHSLKRQKAKTVSQELTKSISLGKWISQKN